MAHGHVGGELGALRVWLRLRGSVAMTALLSELGAGRPLFGGGLEVAGLDGS